MRPEQIAYHEAGHAVAHVLNDQIVAQVSIDRRIVRRNVNNAYGYTASFGGTESRRSKSSTTKAVVLLAGPLAERRYTGAWPAKGIQYHGGQVIRKQLHSEEVTALDLAEKIYGKGPVARGGSTPRGKRPAE